MRQLQGDDFWIDDAQLAALAAPLAKGGYGQYLQRLLAERVF